MTHIARAVAVGLGTLALVACGSDESDHVKAPGLHNAQLPPGTLEQLQSAAEATAKYREVQAALHDGYVRVEACIPRAGSHYVKKSLVDHSEILVREPEILMYAPSRHGQELVAAEYIVFDEGQPRPSLFGRPMDGPFQLYGIALVPRPFYWRHVWLWQRNPEGMFALWNPTVTC